MNQALTITPGDILALAAAIVTLAAAAGAIAKLVDRIRKPTQKQDAMLEELERRSVNDYNRLGKLEEGNIITQRALLALLAHGIDGNDIDAMKKAKNDLTNYLIEHQ